MSDSRTDDRNNAIDLAQGIDAFVDFVRRKGPQEYCDRQGDWCDYYAERGPAINAVEMDEITRLDSFIKSRCDELNLQIPPKRECNVGPNEIEFGFTGLIIQNMNGFVQIYLETRISPSPDWSFRMEALRLCVVHRGGIGGPRWDVEKNKLLFDGRLIKEYRKHPAPNHKILLSAFESAGWAERIPNPFCSIPRDLSPGKTLSDTLTNMMKSIPRIKFRAAGDGTVSWEEIPSDEIS